MQFHLSCLIVEFCHAIDVPVVFVIDHVMPSIRGIRYKSFLRVTREVVEPGDMRTIQLLLFSICSVEFISHEKRLYICANDE